MQDWRELECGEASRTQKINFNNNQLIFKESFSLARTDQRKLLWLQHTNTEMSDHVSFGRIITSMKITKKIKITTKNLGNQVKQSDNT